MKSMERLPKHILHIVLAIAIFLVIAAMIIPPMEGEAYIGDFSVEEFEEGWSCREDMGAFSEGEAFEVTLPETLEAKAGTHIILENQLPAYVKDGMRLCIRASIEDVFIYISGELRESYATENFKHMSNCLPSAYLMVDLSGEDAGKEIRIELVPKADGKALLNEVSIGYGSNVWFPFLKMNAVIVISASFMIVIGLMACFSYLIIRRRVKIDRAIPYLGETMIVVGFWVISESNVRQLLFQSPSFCAVFTYLFVESIGGFVALYFDEVQGQRYYKYYRIMEAVIVFQVLLNSILHFTGVAEYYRTLIFSHSWMIVGIILVLVTLVLDIRSKRIEKYRITGYGMFFFVAACLLEVIGFYFLDFYIIGVFVSIGLLVMLVATILQTIHDEMCRVRERREHLEKMTQMTVQTMARTIDAKDGYTGGHSERVAEYAEELARKVAPEYGLTEEDISRIHYIGLLHDIGKVGVPDAILNKPAQLTAEELQKMRQHTIIGEHLLEAIDNVPGLAEGVRNHHERYDGNGYPDRLKGEEIPLVARILCIADCYDAMTSDRIYRKRLSDEVVKEEIERCSGTQFDPKLAKVFLQMKFPQ